MRPLYILFLLFITKEMNAQSSFEGRIKYKVVTYERNEDAEMTIYFGRPGIRLEVVEAKRPEKEQEIIIINFDSGSVFTLKPGKIFKSSDLTRKPQIDTAEKKTIAGFETTSVLVESTGMPRDLAAVFGSSVLYPASQLVYAVPDVYSTNPELMMIYKGKIVLGGEFFFPEYPDNQWNLNKTIESKKEKVRLFSVEAIEVSKQTLDDKLFVVPSDFTKESYEYYLDSTIADSTAYLDTMVTPLAKPPVKKSKKTPNKKSANAKPKASLRKND